MSPASLHTLVSNRIETPLGPMLAVASDDGLVMLDFHDRRDIDLAREKLGREVTEVASHPTLDLARREVAEYFAGTRWTFTIPLRPANGSSFERRAWEYLQTIPAGETRTYGQQAAALGDAGAARAVGRANGQNFLAIAIPCHRVVGAAGLTGYGGGLDRKAWLLDHERQTNSPDLFSAI